MGWLAAIVGRAAFHVRWWYIFTNFLVFSASLASSKFLSGFSSELVVAVPTMILVVVLPYINLANRLLVRCISVFSDMSYSLYLFHFPFLAFCWFVFIAPNQLQPTIFSYGLFFALLAATLIFCFIMWWLFERHTGHVRELLKNVLRADR
jgi:peptidoglycan/LPS O-acetylase OafA/YrhL